MLTGRRTRPRGRAGCRRRPRSRRGATPDDARGSIPRARHRVVGMMAIVRLTLVEAVRRRLLWALAGLTVVSVAVTTWGVDRLVDVAGRSAEGGLDRVQLALGVSQVLILVAFMFSFVLAMTGAFLAAPAISGDLESGVALAILARPIRRADLVVGRWLGLAIVIALYAVVAGVLETLAVAAVTGYSPPDPLGAALHLAAEGIIPLTLALVLSTRPPPIAGGAVSVVAFGLPGCSACSAAWARSSASRSSPPARTSPTCCCRPTCSGAGPCSRSSRRSPSSPPAACRTAPCRQTRSSRRRHSRRCRSAGSSPGSCSRSASRSCRSSGARSDAGRARPRGRQPR